MIAFEAAPSAEATPAPAGVVQMPRRPGKPRGYPKPPGSGRAKGTPNRTTAQIRAVAQKHGPKAIRALVRLLQTSGDAAIVIKAAVELLDRGYGRPVTTTEISGPDGGPIETQTHGRGDFEVARRVALLLAHAGRTPLDAKCPESPSHESVADLDQPAAATAGAAMLPLALGPSSAGVGARVAASDLLPAMPARMTQDSQSPAPATSQRPDALANPDAPGAPPESSPSPPPNRGHALRWSNGLAIVNEGPERPTSPDDVFSAWAGYHGNDAPGRLIVRGPFTPCLRAVTKVAGGNLDGPTIEPVTASAGTYVNAREQGFVASRPAVISRRPRVSS